MGCCARIAAVNRRNKTRFLFLLATGIVVFVLCVLWSDNLMAGHQDIKRVPQAHAYEERTIVEDEEKPLCTLGVFRNYYNRYHYYPGNGTWDLSGYKHLSYQKHQELGNQQEKVWKTSVERWNENKLPRFVLDLCRFAHRAYPHEELVKCLVKANVSSIATFGNWDGRRYNTALSRFIHRPDLKAEHTCVHMGKTRKLHREPVRDELHSSHDDHNETSRFVEIGMRECPNCVSERWNCHVTSDDTSRDVQIHHVRQDSVIDSIKLNTSDWDASTTQELMLKYSIKEISPDLLLLFLPARQLLAYMGEPLDAIIKQLELLKTLIDKYVPSHTKVFFLTISDKFTSIEMSEKLSRFNHALYELTERDMLRPGSNRYGFVDLLSLSEPRDDWVADGKHMAEVWYQTMMSMFWETYCNSLVNNDW